MNADVHSLIGAYALDAATDAERAEFDIHLQACAHCRQELDGLRETAGLLGASVRSAPSLSLRESVLGGITRVRPLPPPVSPPSPTRWLSSLRGGKTAAKHHPTTRPMRRRLLSAAAAAAVTAAAVACGLSWHPWTASQPATTSAAQQVLHANDVHRYVKQLDGATVTLAFSPSRGKSVLETKNMAAPPPGRTYQTWYMASDGTARPAGFIEPSRTGRSGTLLHGNVDHAALIVVTIEPAGGSRQPTSTPVMTFKLTA